MNPTALQLPPREPKPRSSGVTMMIDGGLPIGYFEDLVASACEYLDFVKFGWGTALVTDGLHRKVDVLRSHGVDHYFGGTLFEKHLLQGRLTEFRSLCHEFHCHYIEVSNGTVDLSNTEKAAHIRAFSDEFRVISEVGFKDSGRADELPPDRWIECVEEDLAAHACLVTLESRESGRAGICRPDGGLRVELVEELLAQPSFDGHLLFEAPSTAVQAYLVKRVGPDVNLGNVAATEVLGLETLRLGLRSDTLTCFEPARVSI